MDFFFLTTQEDSVLHFCFRALYVAPMCNKIEFQFCIFGNRIAKVFFGIRNMLGENSFFFVCVCVGIATPIKPHILVMQ